MATPHTNPGNVAKILDIMRTAHNYILTGKDGKTPAERLGLAQAPLDYEDISLSILMARCAL